MKNTNTAQVKFLINKANAELEAHNYSKSKKTCYQALELDSDNPNIYLILLLAQYEVTEIEDLKNCNIDYESETYKNVRHYAAQDLHDELNKYLSDREKYENIKSNHKSTSIIKDFKTTFVEPTIKFFNTFVQNDNQKEPLKNQSNKEIKETVLNYLSRLPDITKDFYSDKRKGIEFLDLLNLTEFHNKVVRYNKSQEKNTDNYYWFTSTESVFSISTFIYIFFLALQLFIMVILPVYFIMEPNNYIAFISVLIIDILHVLIIKKNYLRIIAWEKIENPSAALYFFKTLFSFVLAAILLIINFYLFIHYLRFLELHSYFWTLMFGFLGSITVNYLYIQICSFFRNLNIFIKTLFLR